VNDSNGPGHLKILQLPPNQGRQQQQQQQQHHMLVIDWVEPFREVLESCRSGTSWFLAASVLLPRPTVHVLTSADSRPDLDRMVTPSNLHLDYVLSMWLDVVLIFDPHCAQDTQIRRRVPDLLQRQQGPDEPVRAASRLSPSWTTCSTCGSTGQAS